MGYKFLNAEQFACVLKKASIGVVFDFTFDQSEEEFHNGTAECWYGAKKESIFDTWVFVVGYYGGSHLFVRDLDEDIDEMFRDVLFAECMNENDLFCVEVTDENEQYLEEIE